MSAAKLASEQLVAFVPISDKDKALSFYRDQLGLTLVEDQSPFALVLDAAGVSIRATFAGEFQPQQFTVLGWRVPDIEAKAEELASAGVVFNKYPFAGDHPHGIWTAPGGAKIGWFTDPFGNVLSLQQDPA
jgi:catechol 2,3-dioxygenase-like lactoylglutathione lyase family enzyme